MQQKGHPFEIKIAKVVLPPRPSSPEGTASARGPVAGGPNVFFLDIAFWHRGEPLAEVQSVFGLLDMCLLSAPGPGESCSSGRSARRSSGTQRPEEEEEEEQQEEQRHA